MSSARIGVLWTILVAGALIALFFGILGASAFADYRDRNCPGGMQCSDAQFTILLSAPLTLAGAAAVGISTRKLVRNARNVSPSRLSGHGSA